MSKQSILVIEKSPIIKEGLLAILQQVCPPFIQIDALSEVNPLPKEVPSLLIVNPTILQQNHEISHSILLQNDILVVGLIYSYHDPAILNNYDGLIHLNDSPNSIKKTIQQLLTIPQEKAEKTVVLSNREKDILKLLVKGFTSNQIAETLHISIHTVNTHRKNITRKLNIKTVSGLTIYAVINNIISMDEAN